MSTAKVANIVPFYGTTPGASDNGTPGRTGLTVLLDLDNDGRRVQPAVLLFDDYAGLETEYDAGSATTVLDAAIDTFLAASAEAEALPSAAAAFVSTEISY